MKLDSVRVSRPAAAQRCPVLHATLLRPRSAPAARHWSRISGVKCKPAVGAATDPLMLWRKQFDSVRYRSRWAAVRCKAAAASHQSLRGSRRPFLRCTNGSVPFVRRTPHATKLPRAGPWEKNRIAAPTPASRAYQTAPHVLASRLQPQQKNFHPRAHAGVSGTVQSRRENARIVEHQAIARPDIAAEVAEHIVVKRILARETTSMREAPRSARGSWAISSFGRS